MSNSDKQIPLSDETVLEHTASMWKYNPINKDEPKSHSESCIKNLNVPKGKLYGARVRGKKHKHEGTNCDDWFEIDNIDDWILIAVSDGAGSKKFSRLGAKQACQTSIAYIKSEFTKIKDNTIIDNLSLPVTDNNFSKTCSMLASIVQKSVISAFDSVEALFLMYKDNKQFSDILNRKLEFKDFSCTLLILVAIPIQINSELQYLTISCQIGDGMLASININENLDKSLKLLGQADSGDFSGETEFLNCIDMKKINNLMNRTKISRGVVSCIMVMTDGVSDDYYPNNPQLLRLYLDLILNGIIDTNFDTSNIDSDLIQKIPKPVSYPWIDNPSVTVPIYYIDKIMETANLSLEQLWTNKSTLYSIKLNEENKTEEALKVWLDNYTQRGSFDDRTLVIFNI